MAFGDFLPPIVSELRGSIEDFENKMGSAKKIMAGTTEDMKAKSAATSRAVAIGIGAVGAAMTGAGVILTRHAENVDDAFSNLSNTIRNLGKSVEEFRPDIEGGIDDMARFGHNAADVNEALARLTVATKDPRRAVELLGDAADLAAFKNIGLVEASELLVRVQGGQDRALKALGIEGAKQVITQDQVKDAVTRHREAIEKLRRAQQDLADTQAILGTKDELTIGDQIRLRKARDAVAEAQQKVDETAREAASAQAEFGKGTDIASENIQRLRERIGGTAQVEATGFADRIEEAKTRLENMAASAGQVAGPALTIFGGALTLTAGLATTFQTSITNIGSAMAGSAAASVAATALVGAGVVALGVLVGVGLHKVIEEVWPEFNRFFEDVGANLYDWFADVWSPGWQMVGAAMVDVLAPAYSAWNGFWMDQGEKLAKFFEGADDVQSTAERLRAHQPAGGVHGGGFGYQGGGIVSGPLGAPQLAIVHGGERIVRAENPGVGLRGFGGGGVTISIGAIQVHGGGDPQKTARAVREELLRLANNNAGLKLA